MTPLPRHDRGRGSPRSRTPGRRPSWAVTPFDAQPDRLVLHAAAAGLPSREFVLHDPPCSPDDESARDQARRYGHTIRRLLAQDERAEAMETFCRLTGMPDEVIDRMRGTHRWAESAALAPTLAYDSAVMGDLESGGA
jgi:hypothetical protein